MKQNLKKILMMMAIIFTIVLPFSSKTFAYNDLKKHFYETQQFNVGGYTVFLYFEDGKLQGMEFVAPSGTPNPILGFDPSPEDNTAASVPGVNPGDNQGFIEYLLDNENYETKIAEDMWLSSVFADVNGKGPGLIAVWNPGVDGSTQKVKIYVITPEAVEYGNAYGYNTNGDGYNEQLVNWLKSGGKSGSGAPSSSGSSGSGDTSTDAQSVNMGLSGTIGFTDGGQIVVHPKANPELSIDAQLVFVDVEKAPKP